MDTCGKNSARTGRTIDHLDDRKNPTAVDAGENTPHGRKMPDYDDEILEEEENAALEHVKVSGIDDVAEDGSSPAKRRPTKSSSR